MSERSAVIKEAGYWLSLLGLLWLWICATGCESPPVAGSGSIAWVTINGHTAKEISQAAKIVLLHDGYHVTREASEELTLEKAGTAWDEITDGNWGEGVTLRMKLRITPQLNQNYLVHTRVYIVRAAGDRVFEDTREMTRLNRKPYQKLLDEIKTRLDTQLEPRMTE